MEYWYGKKGPLFGVNVQPELLVPNPVIRFGDKVRVFQMR